LPWALSQAFISAISARCECRLQPNTAGGHILITSRQ
jgi:hypothetical protein